MLIVQTYIEFYNNIEGILHQILNYDVRNHHLKSPHASKFFIH